MDQILELLESGQVQKALELLRASQIDKNITDNLLKEYKENSRIIRATQVGKIQKPKEIKNPDGSIKAQIPAQIIKVPYQKKIVRVATAFEYGKPCTITPNESNDLSSQALAVWRSNRLDGKVKEVIKQRKSLLQGAILFYIKQTNNKRTLLQRILNTGLNYDIKSRVLNPEVADFYPYFDQDGDMVLFTYEFEQEIAGKKVSNVWVYDDLNVYKSTNKTGVFVTEKEEHGFNKIPVVYTSQDLSEWYDATDAIDRYEVAISKLAGSNNRTAHPILKTTGKVSSLPDIDDEGKTINLEIKKTPEGIMESKADYLTHDNAPESMKLESEELKEAIYSITSTPDLSFNNVKGIGNISGVALELLFLDSQIKASDNEEINRAIVTRILNVIVSGLVTTVSPSLSSQADLTYFEVEFNSIMPNDFAGLVKTLSTGVQSQIISKDTAVQKLGLTDDNLAEITQIQYEQTPKTKQ